MEVKILGPLEVVDGGTRIGIPGGKQRELLAILLIHANEIVSSDRLVDGLWGEMPPPSALKSLQALVSRLRGTLGSSGGALETHGHGYRLRLESGELDSAVFHDALEDARRARSRGEPERASEQLQQALGLWRGPALIEFRYADFAQPEIARLDELRLAAQEERIEADLELGRHDELVVELESLLAEHPLRERPRCQLMLALYRSGRQAEALQTYQEGRRALAEELGLEPSESMRRLERSILDHDPALASPKPPARPRARAGSLSRARHPRRIVAVGVLLLAAAIGAAFYQGARGDDGIEEASVLSLDPGSGDVTASIPLGTAPSTVSVGAGSVWVLDADDRTVSQIDPATHAEVRRFSTPSATTDIAAGAGGLWIGSTTSAIGVLPRSVARYDPKSELVGETIELPTGRGGEPSGVFPGSSRQHLAVAPDAVWVINPDLTVSRIDPRSNRIVARVKKVRAQNIAAGDGDVWVTEGNKVTEIDAVTNAVVRRVTLDAGFFLTDIAVGGGAVWAADPQRGKVWRIDTGPRSMKRAVPLGMWVAGLAYGEGAVWATNEITDEIHRIDPRTGEAEPVDSGASPRDVDAGEGEVWVTAAPPPPRDADLPSAVCQDVQFRGAGRPDLLLVSSLPLQGDVSRALARAIAGGVELVLEQRGFEAGEFSVGHQACDSSTAQAGGEDFFRCGTNAKAFSRNQRVVGVVGSYQSFCSYLQIPIANQAPGGPLAMISPSNTDDLLTGDDSLYPSGTRSFFRLAAANRLQGLAQVEIAKGLGHERLFVLDAGEYGDRYTADLREHARRYGIEVVGSARFDPEAESFARLARRVARSGPQSVAIVGVFTLGSAALIRDLRAALGPGVAISAPDGFVVPELTKLAGAAAEGMYLTTYGIPNDRLPPRGRQFLRAFVTANGGDPGPDYAAAYGAQAAEILLDAIARSDGTRRSVLDEVSRTVVKDGILGAVDWNAQGDLLEAPITILRVQKGDYVVDRVFVSRPVTSG